MEEEKKDIHGRTRQFEHAYANLAVARDILPHNRDLVRQFIRDCRLGKTVRNRQKKKIGPARCLKYISILKKISSQLDEPFEKVSQQQMEKYIEGLEMDTRLAASTKLDYKKSLMKFYKWLLGDGRHLPDIVSWFDTYDTPREVSTLRREEVEQMTNACNVRDKAIIMFLFDSGARAEECLNVKIQDLTMADGTYKVRIVHSKTNPRTVHLPIATSYLKIWLKSHEVKNEDDYLFALGYQALRQMLHRLGKQILGKRVSPHLLRHSSATYYANILNHQQLCYRYGWAMASKMPNRYIDREGIFDGETIKAVQTNDLASLEKQNQSFQEEIAMLKETNLQLGRDVQGLKQWKDELIGGKGLMRLLVCLSNKREILTKE